MIDLSISVKFNVLYSGSVGVSIIAQSAWKGKKSNSVQWGKRCLQINDWGIEWRSVAAA